MMFRIRRTTRWLATSVLVSGVLGIAISIASAIPPGLASTEPVLDSQISSDVRLTVERELAWQRRQNALLLAEVGGRRAVVLTQSTNNPHCGNPG